ncbi:DEAD/DEAH box helicase family protein [Streptomyces cinnabarinus]|uniref:DEAD/DEAH box helicase family protein n=1 Tax=Streptomyces cinnabarinus TaxID=67287 RepID=A0ABY7KID8_9ACTN|nr:DEAD/DEAH box helicase family protein [Streptomyces cinnabarinus]WAZ22496.1 DEAD/DEAH box helicase family protein [Streptomyces cinnabarinus]
MSTETSGSGREQQGDGQDIGQQRSNFAFLRAEWPALYDEARRAERLAHADPRTSCFYARRVLELAVHWMYDHDTALRPPYRNDLSALLHEPSLRNLVGPALGAKMDLVRRQGNYAVHRPAPVRSADAVRTVAELFHVFYWFARTYAPAPESAPAAGVGFDSGHIPRPVPAEVRLRRQAELKKQAEEDRARWDAQAGELAEERAKGAQLSAEVARLRARVTELRKANAARPDTHDYDEAATRDLFIDLLLKEAGWDLAEERDREFPVEGEPGVISKSGKGFVDYVLWGDDDRPLAVVEAKRTRVDARAGRQQAELYADVLEATYQQRPVIFCTNGYETFLWDDGNGYPPRRVQGFRTKDELHWLIRQRAERPTLAASHVNTGIAGRPYQLRAIERVGRSFEQERRRRALLVMATGTGKTRTTVALAELLQRAGWARRVLFLADRQALVNQAVRAFKEHLPNSVTVNLLTEKKTDAHVYVSTYPTMMNLVDEVTEDGRRRFGPGFFDLVVIDEAHRSVYDKYGELFEYFDSLLLGLTATPKDDVDHNTYRLFQLRDGLPTDSYSLDQAASEGFLVKPNVVEVPFDSLRRGFRYDDLTEEQKEAWDNLEWTTDGQVPDAVSADEVNRFLFNAPTVDKALEVLMRHGLRVEGGDRLGKTIIFAKNSRHALFIEERFNLHYPRGAGHDARVITYQEKNPQQLIDDFSDPAKAPDIAISVDMLDTGVDVPEVLNLVLFKPVYSRTKFWQMIGRGTRLCPDVYGPGRDKDGFHVFDLCGNAEFFNQELDRAGSRQAPTLTEQLLRHQLALIRALDRRQAPDPAQDGGPDAVDTEAALRWAAAHRLHETVRGMNLENFLVRPHRREVERFGGDFATWHRIGEDAAHTLGEEILGLPSDHWPEGDDRSEEAKRFDLLAYRLQLAALEGGADYGRLRGGLQELALDLLGKTNIPVVRDQAPLLEAIADEAWWRDVTVPMLEHVRRRLRGLAHLLDTPAARKIVYTDIAEEHGDLSEIELKGLPVGTDEERFKQKARAYLQGHRERGAVHRLWMNEQVTAADLTDLEEVFLAEGIASAEDLEQRRAADGGLGVFLRRIGGMDRGAAQEAFAGFVGGHELSADQAGLVGLMVRFVAANGLLGIRELYENSLFNSRGVIDDHFTDDEIDALEDVFRTLRARAVADA